MFEPSHKAMELFLKGCNGEEFRKQALSDGMISLFQDGVAKAEQGITSLEDVLQVTGGIL